MQVNPAFKDLLSLKNLAHLVGDKFIEGMKIGNQKLEGNTDVHSLQFLKAGLSFIMNKYEFTQGELQKIEAEFSEALLLASKIQEAQRYPFDEASKVLVELDKKIVDSLIKLTEGEKLLIPMGWFNKAGGHSILVVCYRTVNGIYLEAVQTGGGIDYHQTQIKQDRRTFVNTVRNYILSEKDLLAYPTIRALLELNIFGVHTNKTIPEYKAEDFYRILSPYQVTSMDEIPFFIKLGKGWRHAQLSGTCSMRCLMAYLQIQLKENTYHLVSKTLKYKAVKYGLQHFESELNKDHVIRKFFSLAIADIAFRATKHLTDKSVTQAEKQKRILDCSLQPAETKKPYFSPPNLTLEKKDAKLELEENPFSLTPLKPNSLFTSLPTTPIKSFTSADELITHLKYFEFYIGIFRFMADDRPLLSSFLIDLGRHFIKQKWMNPQVILQLKNSQEKCEALLDYVVKISRYLFKETAKNIPESSSELALTYSMIIVRIVGSFLDDLHHFKGTQRIDYYQIPPMEIRFLEKIPELFHPLWNKDWMRIESQFSDKHKPVCPEFIMENDNERILFKLSEGDFLYAHSHMLGKDFKEADREFEKQLNEYKKRHYGLELVSQDKWRANWLWVNGLLPAHFNQLRELSWMVSVIKSYKTVTTERNHLLSIFWPRLGLPNQSKKLHIEYSLDERSVLEYSNRSVFKEKASALPRSHDCAKPFLLKTIWEERENYLIAKGDPHFTRSQVGTVFNFSKIQGVSFIPALLDFFTKNLGDLKLVNNQISFSRVLFCNDTLLKLLKEKKIPVEECFAFFDHAIRFYEDQVLSFEDRQGSLQVIAFLLEQKGRFCNYCKDKEKLKNTREAIRKYLGSEFLKDPKIKIHLCLALLESYATSSINTFEEVKELIQMQVEVNALKASTYPDTFLHKSFFYLASDVIYSHYSPLHKILLENHERYHIFFTSLIQKMNIQIPAEIMWDLKSFPFASAVIEGRLFEIHLLTGELFVNKVALNDLPTSITSTSLFQSLINGKRTVAIRSGNYYELSDETGEIRISDKPWYYRKFAGVWYKYANGKKRILPGLFSPAYDVWKSLEHPPHYILAGKQPLYRMDNDSTWIFLTESNEKRYHYIDLKSLPHSSGILDFDSLAMLWQETSSKELRLQLPQFLDNQGAPLEFNFNNNKWIMRHQPLLFLSENQTIGIFQLKKFLILENKQGDRFALLPNQEFSKQEVTEKIHNCLIYRLEGNELMTRNPYDNAYLSYVMLIHATTPSEYHRSLETLKKAYKFEAYSENENDVLFYILESNQYRKDYTGFADAIRLYATWLHEDNVKRNQTTSDSFVNKTFTQNHYYQRSHHLPQNMQLEQYDWIPKDKAESSFFKPNTLEIPLTNEKLKHFPDLNYFQTLPFRSVTRPLSLTNEIWKHFPRLFEMAMNGNTIEQREVRRLITLMQSDEVTPVILMLDAALEKHPLHSYVQREEDLNRLVELLDNYKKNKKWDIKQKDITPFPHLRIKKTEKLAPKSNTQLIFKRSHIPYYTILRDAFDTAIIATCRYEKNSVPPFELDTKDPFIHKKLSFLNEDLQLGIEKNQRMPKYSLCESLKIDLDLVSKEANRLEFETIRMANTPPKDPQEALLQKIQNISGQRPFLDFNDCVLLFLHADPNEFRHHTHLTTDKEIQNLFQLIGSTIEMKNCESRFLAVQKAIESGDSQKIGQELSLESKVEHPTLLVFEHRLNLVLHEHQIAGIQAMNSKKSVFLQRIQGGGKTLVFGQIMALLKADGFHLSIHVPPTAQYATNLYDMAYRSQLVFGQREHTIVFNDEPFRFTLDYLNWILETLNQAILNKEYITMTHESLQALRCKYLKNRFLNDPRTETSTQKLKEILFLIRERAIFTFDELHLPFDARKELNMPFGNPKRINPDHAQTLKKCLLLAIRSGKLDIYNSSRQSISDREEMKKFIVETISPNLRPYVTGETDYLPDDIKPGKEADQIILLRQLIADKWLEERLALSVNEHHGLNDSHPRVSIPFIANMKPAKGSEFSDPFVMMLNTFITYLVGGLNAEQVATFIIHYKKEAQNEKLIRIQENPDFTLHDTSAVHKFREILNLPLFEMDAQDSSCIEKVQSALRVPQENVQSLLLDFVISHPLQEVDLYEKEVSSNGQNSASMARSIIGYSGSIDNPNLTPVGVSLELEKGTNGQTIHRLLQDNQKVFVIDDSPKSLFSSKILTKNIRAIIDVGNIFRGKTNEKAARFITKKLNKIDSTLKGVLFFGTDSGKLCFMPIDPTFKILELSGQDNVSIEKETGFKKEELFTYYDQEHITGTDISQAPYAFALLTWSEHTLLHEVLQGSRRLRELDRDQKIIHVVPKEAQLPSTLKELLLFAFLNEIEIQREDNLTFCIQKMENAAQQFILDVLYKLNVEEEKVLFNQCCSLFEKNRAIDLYKEYAKKRDEIPVEFYLRQLKDQLIKIVENGSIKGITELDLFIEKEIIQPALDSLKPTVKKGNPHRESTHVQFREQQKVQEEVKETQKVSQMLREVDYRKRAADEKSLDPNKFFSKDYFKLNDEFPIHIENINSDPGLFKSANLERIFEGFNDVKFLKPTTHLLLMQQDNEFHLMMCAIEEGIQMISYIEHPIFPKKEIKRWVLRPNGKRYPYLNPIEEPPIDHPQVKRLLLQSLFFNGEYYYLSRHPWCDLLDEWLPQERLSYATYFESLIAPLPESYLQSKAYKILHKG